MAEQETWDWVEGGKTTAQGAAEGYAEGGIVGGMVGGFKAYLGYASDHPGVGTLTTSQGPETRAEISKAESLGVLRAEWGTVGGYNWTHPPGIGRQHNAQDVAFRLNYGDAGLFSQNPLMQGTPQDRERSGVAMLYAVAASQGYLAPGMFVRTRDEDPELAYLSLESEGAWGADADVQMIQLQPAEAMNSLFQMGFVGNIPRETMFVSMMVLYGSGGSPDVYQAPRGAIMQVGILRKDVPVVVFWRKSKRDYRAGSTASAPWLYGVQMIPAGNAPSYGPAPNGGGSVQAKGGLGAVGWLGIAGLAVPIVMGLVKR